MMNKNIDVIALFIQGNIDVVVTDDDYIEFLKAVTAADPLLHWDNGRPMLAERPPHLGLQYRMSVEVFPCVRYLCRESYFPEDDKGTFPLVIWADILNEQESNYESQ